ncbi:MAG: hypothetical protein JSW71_23040 [Gemmatimonadota bacterium]|nr:MAG: hypothetical protein JSW71_23040 [Gemmatimonadota bacterium]
MIQPVGSPCPFITTQVTPPPLGVSQSLLLGIAVIALFGVEVFATGLAAKKLDVFDANYGKALWAAVLKNGILAGAAYLLSRYVPESHRIPALILVGTLAPIVVYKLVFESTIAQAVLIWIAVLLVVSVAGIALVYGALSLGATLDERFDLVVRPQNPLFALPNLGVARDSTNNRCPRITSGPFHRRELPDAH